MKSLFIALTVLTLYPIQLCAELYSSKIKFQNILENKEAVIGAILVIHQDSEGYIWFGGESALIRYDGYTLKQIFLEDQENPDIQGAPVSAVANIREDSMGRIWVSSGSGVLYFDRQQETVVRLPDHPSLAETPLSAIGIREVIELPNSKLAVATYSGMYIVDSITGEGKIYREPEGLSPGRVNTVLHNEGQTLWIGTGTGLDKMNIQSGEIENIKPYSAKPDSAPDNGVSAMIFGDDGKLWLGTDRGLIHFDPASKNYKRYERDDADPHSFSEGEVWDMFKDTDGYIWIAADRGGLNMLDPKTEKFSIFKHEKGRNSSLNSDVVRAVIVDNSGDLWVGNFPTGVNFFDKSSAAITAHYPDTSDPNSIAYDSIMSVVEDPSGNIWVGTDGAGLDYFDRDTGIFSHNQYEENNPNSVSANGTLSLMLDSRNILWAGTWGGGAYLVDLNDNNKITHLPGDAKRAQTKSISHSKRLNNDKVWCFLEDSKGYIWICTHEGGLSRYDRNSGEFTHYLATSEESSITGNQVWIAFEDSSGQIWVGTTVGLGIIDQQSGEFSNFVYEKDKPGSLSNPAVLCIFEDSKNRLWFGSGAGLNLYNRKSNTFTSFGKKDGFFDDSIRSILEDKQGRLWMGTNSGVTTFDPETKKVKNYNRESGKLVGGFNYDAALMTSKGEAIFGGKNGLRIYQTEKMQDNKTLPPIVLTDFKLFSDSIKVGSKNGLLNNSINHTDEIELNYTQSVLEFEFSALNYRDPEKNRYAYLLDGFDENWVYSGDQRRAKYTNLDAGTYTFRVKASNNDGVWNEEGTSVTLIQRPPPWETWWAYTLYALSIIAIILWFIHAQRQKRRLVEEQNRILEIKVAQRTAELSKKNNDIQAMLSNMHQGLFTIEGEGKIHPEYSGFLEEIYETNEISGCNVMDFLFKNSNLGSDIFNQVKEAIGAMVGEDEMNFDFNSHLLVGEYDVTIGKVTKNLHLDWNPILVDDEVEKLMVTVRDITELKRMEAESLLQQKELDIIVQLLNVPSKKYLNFEKSAADFIAENQQCIGNSAEKDNEIIALLFRNMHTIKGNCRTFGFKYISDIVHDVETVYSNLKNSADAVWEQQSLLDDLERVKEAIAEYAKVYRDVLGRDDDDSGRPDGLWVDAKTIQDIQDSLHLVENQIPSITEILAFNPVRSFFAKAMSAPIDTVLEDIVNSLPSIAKQLNKENPSVEINSENVRIKDAAHDLMNNVFAHILRNSVDHGIEKPEDRLLADKPVQGSIKVYTSLTEDCLRIHVCDDGRGVNIDRLFDKGVENALWKKEDQPKTSEIAELIFSSGISTSEAVSDISGRGVGMDAVKQFMRNKGGDIYLNLLAEKTEESAFVPFETILELPAGLYTVVEDDLSAVA